MKKYILRGIFLASFSVSFVTYASISKVGGGSTCTPRSLTCPDGSTVITSFCGSDQQAASHVCPYITHEK